MFKLKQLVSLFLAVSLLVPSLSFAAGFTYTEDFSTTTYKDVTNTTASWSGDESGYLETATNDVLINNYVANNQGLPDVSANNNGMFIITWKSYQSDVGDDVFAQIFDSTGTPVGSAFQVNNYTTGSQCRRV